MTRFALTLAASLMLATPSHGAGRMIDGMVIDLGAASRLTCQQFLALAKPERDGAESWAYGYLTAWQEVLIHMAERNGDDLQTTLRSLAVKPAHAQKFMQDVEATCREHPAHFYVDAITAVYAKWRDRK
jgi:hypothetical protein